MAADVKAKRVARASSPWLAAALCLCGPSAFCARIELKAPTASCVLETQGARILSFRTAGHGEVLWNDDPVQTAAEDWAHGGIPVCWPWFGRRDGAGIHGFAWKRPFRVVRQDGREAVLLLETPEATLTYTAFLDGESLRLSLVTSNVTDRPFVFSTAVHPYFRVGERDKTWLSGVKDAPYAVDSAQDGVIPWAEGSDRVVRIADKALGRTLTLRADNAVGVCVWNPGAAGIFPGRLPDGEWRRFVCVEPVARNAETKSVVLAPHAEHLLSLVIRADGKGVDG